MDISKMLSNGIKELDGQPDNRRLNRQYSTRHASTTYDQGAFAMQYAPYMQGLQNGNNGAAAGSGYPRSSPAKNGGKQVLFQLIDPEDPRKQARLPMRVMISPHDTTESIISTVKNFFGLYEYGVSFENKDGVSIIAAYDNFENDMTVYVRTVWQNSAPPSEHARDSVSPNKPSLGAPFEMRPPQSTHTYSPSNAFARSVGARSMSPQSDIGRRSASAVPGSKSRPQRTKSKDNSVYGDLDGYSSGDNGGGSVASSRRSKTEVVNPEISTDNIVEGGRRKRAFESSELPLFVPPQVPITTSVSSISPQRRAGPPSAISPHPFSNQHTFSYTQPLPSPQSLGGGAYYAHSGMMGNGFGNAFQPPNRQLRGRSGAVTYPPSRQATGGILPTPDPTVGSAISDEDAAMQLMRLGDPTAFSHGRTSTSTVDDALSGKAELASSDEEDEDEEDDVDEESAPHIDRSFSNGDAGPQRKKQRLMNELPSGASSGDDSEDHRDGTFLGSDDVVGDQNGQRKLNYSKPGKIRNSMTGSLKTGKPRANSMMKPKSKSLSSSNSAMPAPPRNTSVASSVNFQHQLGDDEDDLSSKPRCQRCRKSKKGCDRQRPCGRCKDAGIGADGCISEDEGNGRKGRFGRHMGVSVKKAEEVFNPDAAPHPSLPANGYFLTPALPDKSKKRKR